MASKALVPVNLDEKTLKKAKGVTLSVVGYQEVAANLQAQADRAVIDSAESYATGGDLIKIARTEGSKVEDERKDIVGPFNKLVKFINAAYKTPKDAFAAARTTVETKMLVWKREEDKRIRAEAEKERVRLENEALARAELEKDDESQDEVLEAAAEAGEELVENAGLALQRGNFGSSTGTKKIYTTNVSNMQQFLGALIAHIEAGNKRGIDLGALIEFKKSGMNKLAENCYKAGTKNMPGAEFVESENIRVY